MTKQFFDVTWHVPANGKAMLWMRPSWHEDKPPRAYVQHHTSLSVLPLPRLHRVPSKERGRCSTLKGFHSLPTFPCGIGIVWLSLLQTTLVPTSTHIQ
jgi:hypothetical protein